MLANKTIGCCITSVADEVVGYVREVLWGFMEKILRDCDGQQDYGCLLIISSKGRRHQGKHHSKRLMLLVKKTVFFVVRRYLSNENVVKI